MSKNCRFLTIELGFLNLLCPHLGNLSVAAMRYGSGSGIFRSDKKRFSRTGRRRFDGCLREEVPLLVPDFFSVRLPMIRPEKSGAGSVAVNEAEGDLGEGQNDDDDLMMKKSSYFCRDYWDSNRCPLVSFTLRITLKL